MNHTENLDLNVDDTDEDGRTCLHMSAKAGHLQTVDLLLRKQADPNLQELTKKATPLMEAARWGREDVVVRLLEAGARRDLRNKWHQTAADMARAMGHFDLAALIEGKRLFI